MDKPVFWRRAAALGGAVLAPLAFCLLAAFSLPCDLVIDGHGNGGDETTSASLSSDLSFTSPKTPLPGYGYQSDGRPWNWGVDTAPFYGWFYDAALHAAPPVRRIEAARLVSRALCGAGLYLITLSLLQLITFPRTNGTWPLVAQLMMALCVALIFMNAPGFRFIASFARVEALGFFFLAAVIAAAPRVLAKPTGPSVFLFTLLSLSVAWTSYIAFYLVAALSTSVVCLSAGATAGTPSSIREKAVTLLLRWGLPSISALAVYYLLSSWLSGALLSGPAGYTFFRILNLWAHPSQWPLSLMSARPEPLWFLSANEVGLLGLLVANNIWKGKQPAKFAMTALVLLVAMVLYQIWLLPLTPARYTYDILITTAFAFWLLLVLGFILRDHPMERRFMIAATMAALVYASFHAPQQPKSLCREDVPGRLERLWPFQTLTSGPYNPFKDAAVNRSRRLHAEAARRYLEQHGVHGALATDPMFATMSDPSLQFYFLNNSYSSIESPAAEEQLVAGLVTKSNIRHIVSTEFGESADLDLDGFVALRRCLREAPGENGVCHLGNRTVKLTRVFRTDEVVHTTDVYVYANKNSTPISIYTMSIS
jgi:hypothetical protein